MEEQKTQNSPAAKNTFLECERDIVFILMMLVAGYFGAFTYSIRGGVFCNAQTGNFVLLAMALGNGRWFHALYFFIPITAYCVGTMLSEVLPGYVKKSHLIRWDTLLILIEILVVIFLGFLPESAPVQITQVLINFICSMQYNTFRRQKVFQWPPPSVPITSGRWESLLQNLSAIPRNGLPIFRGCGPMQSC